MEDQGGPRTTSPESRYRRLEAVEATQGELDRLHEQASEEILSVEEKYAELVAPLYAQRRTMIDRIQHFWFLAIMNHSGIQPVVATFEVPCLKFLSRFEVEEKVKENAKTRFKLHFYFEENPYFTNAVLTKEIYLTPSGERVSASGPIQWREGCRIPQQIKESLKYHAKGQTRGPKTFFQWLSGNGEGEGDDPLSDMFKEDLWPNPLQYFLVPDLDYETGREDEEEDQEPK